MLSFHHIHRSHIAISYINCRILPWKVTIYPMNHASFIIIGFQKQKAKLGGHTYNFISHGSYNVFLKYMEQIHIIHNSEYSTFEAIITS